MAHEEFHNNEGTQTLIIDSRHKLVNLIRVVPFRVYLSSYHIFKFCRMENPVNTRSHLQLQKSIGTVPIKHVILWFVVEAKQIPLCTYMTIPFSVFVTRFTKDIHYISK